MVYSDYTELNLCTLKEFGFIGVAQQSRVEYKRMQIVYAGCR